MSPYAMPKIGDVVAGKYRLQKVAGEGGMGIVYAAEHLVLKQRVAVKVLLPSGATSEAVVERFAREAQAAARIQSEHVARVMDAGSLASGAPFLVMEFLEGCDLEELLDLQKALPVTEVVDYMLQALEALAHAHAVGIVHRDLKPANLFLTSRPDGSAAIKMLDFGISKSVTARPEDKVLTGQAVLGSPVYMSPEQLRNAKAIDARADLWSLGVVAYELVAGRPPFDGDGVGEIFAAILEKTPVPLHERRPGVDPGFSAIVDKCLTRDADQRWSSAASLARALAPYGSGEWADVVPRIEQVLTRAKALDVQPTPMEIRQVELAIASAAEGLRSFTRAGEPDPRGGDTKGYGEAPPATRTMAMKTLRRTLGTPAGRWAGLTLGAAAFAIFLVGVLIMKARPAAGDPVSALTAKNLPMLDDGPPKAAAPSAPVVDAPPDESDELPEAAQVEEKSASAPPAAPRKGGRPNKPPPKPTRPKFLNSRE